MVAPAFYCTPKKKEVFVRLRVCERSVCALGVHVVLEAAGAKGRVEAHLSPEGEGRPGGA